MAGSCDLCHFVDPYRMAGLGYFRLPFPLVSPPLPLFAPLLPVPGPVPFRLPPPFPELG